MNMSRRYQRGNQNPYIEEEQTTHWPKEKVQKDKQRSIENSSPQVDGHVKSDTSFWFRTNHYLLLLINTNCLADSQPMPILYNLLIERFCDQINVTRIQKGQSKMDNPEKLATLGTQEEEKQTKTQHNMCWTPLCTKNNVITTWTLLQTTGNRSGNHNTELRT